MNKTRIIAAAAATSAALMFGANAFAAGSADGAKPAAAGAPTEISIMTVTTMKDLPDNTNIIWKEMEKRTNTKLDITFVPASNYGDKLSVTLASGNLPDVTYIDNPGSAIAQKSMLQGAFWDLTNLYKGYPELAKYPEVSWLNTKGSDGKNYCVPRPRAIYGQAGMGALRQDWLDALKLKMPETADELTAVLKSFVEKDPDGNGQKDTTGLVGFIASDGTNLGNFGNLITMFTGAPPTAGYLMLKDGKLVSILPEPRFKEGLAWLTKLYADGLLHKDFAIMKQQQVRDTGMSGKAGAILENPPGASVVTLGLQKVIPTASFTPFTYLKTKDGKKFSFAGAGYLGAYAIAKKVPEAKMKAILGFLDATSREDLWEYANYGVEGVHFVRKGVFRAPTPQAAVDRVGQPYMGQIASREDKYFYAYAAPNSPEDRINAYVKLIDTIATEGFALPDPAAGLVVESYIAINKEINKKITDMALKVILGAESINGWDAFAASVLSDKAYTDAIRDMDAAYKIKMGK